MSPVLFLSGMFIPIPVLNPLHSPEKSKVCSTRILPAPKIAPASGNLSQLEGSMIILPSSKIPNSGAGPCLESRWSSEAQNRTLFVVCMCMLSYINSVNWYIPRLAMCSLWTLWIWKNCNNLVSRMYHVSKIWLGDFVLITWLQLFVGDSLRPPLWYCMWVFLQLSGERWRPPPGQVEKSYIHRWMYNKGRCNKGNFGCIPVQCRTLHLHPTSIIVVFGTKCTYHYRMVLQVFCMFASISPHHDGDLPIPPTNGMR